MLFEFVSFIWFICLMKKNFKINVCSKATGSWFSLFVNLILKLMRNYNKIFTCFFIYESEEKILIVA